MRVLLLTLSYLPDAAPNAPVMASLAQGLSALGHKVSIITAFPHYGESKPYPGYRGWRLKYESYDGIHVHRTPLYVGREGPRANKILSWLSFNMIGTWVAAKVGPADVIIASSPPPTLGLSEWLLARLWGVPYVYNAQDIYPDVAMEQGYLRSRLLTAFLRKLEGMIYAKAGAVTVLSEVHRSNLLAKGVPSHKVVVIPNFVDTDFLRPLPRQNAWSARQGLDGRFVVTYAGNMGASQGLETLLEAAMLVRHCENLLFLLIGRGPGRAVLESQAQTRRLTNIRFLPFQPGEDVPEVYASADLHVVLLRRKISASVPSKVYSIMASGRPLVAAVPAGNEVASLVERSGAGLVVPPEEPRELADAILRLAKDPETRNQMGECGRACVLRHYPKEAGARMYDVLIRRLVAQHEEGRRHVRHSG